MYTRKLKLNSVQHSAIYHTYQLLVRQIKDEMIAQNLSTYNGLDGNPYGFNPRISVDDNNIIVEHYARMEEPKWTDEFEAQIVGD